MPSHLIHTWCLRTPRFECQVISAAPSCKFVTSTRRAQHLIHVPTYVSPSPPLICQTSMSATPISEAKTLPGRLCYTWDDMKCNAHYNYPKSMQMCQYLDFVLAHRLSGGMEYWTRSTTLCCTVPDISYTLEKSPPTSSPFVVAQPTSDLGLARYICNLIPYPNTLLVA